MFFSVLVPGAWSFENSRLVLYWSQCRELLWLHHVYKVKRWCWAMGRAADDLKKVWQACLRWQVLASLKSAIPAVMSWREENRGVIMQAFLFTRRDVHTCFLSRSLEWRLFKSLVTFYFSVGPGLPFLLSIVSQSVECSLVEEVPGTLQEKHVLQRSLDMVIYRDNCHEETFSQRRAVFTYVRNKLLRGQTPEVWISLSD